MHILDSDKRMSIVVHALQSGMSIDKAKIQANHEMSGAAGVMFEAVLAMNEILTSRTMQMIKENMEHQNSMAKEFLSSKDIEADLKAKGITERERDILTLVVAGYSSKEIAQRLSISFRTVETHRAHIMQKTGSSNIIELARAHMV